METLLITMLLLMRKETLLIKCVIKCVCLSVAIFAYRAYSTVLGENSPWFFCNEILYLFTIGEYSLIEKFIL